MDLVYVGDGNTDRDRVRDAVDLVQLVGQQVRLTPKGREHVGLCPFHDDSRPSFAVVTHKGHAFYKCHACGAAGDAFKFVMDYHQMTFPEALRHLAEFAGVTLSDQPRRRTKEDEATSPARLREAHALAARFFQHVLKTTTPDGADLHPLIAERGVTPEIASAFGLGLAPDRWDGLLEALTRRKVALAPFEAAGLIKRRTSGDGSFDGFRNRLMFPITDAMGNIVAFGARRIDPEDEPKYLNSPESAIFHKSKTLYGLHLAKRSIMDRRETVITEGYTDVISCHQAGLTNVVGTLGTALTREHASVLKRLCDRVVLLFDGDAAGQRAADRAVEVFFAEPIDVAICILPDNLDPDDLLRREGGVESLQTHIANATDAMTYKIGQFRRELDAAASPTARARRLEAFLGELADLGFGAVEGVRRRMLTAEIAHRLGVGENEIDRMIRAARRPARVATTSRPGTPEPTSPSLLETKPAAPLSPLDRNRRAAEREFVGLLIYDGGLLDDELVADADWDGREGAAAGGDLLARHPASSFADPGLRRLLDVLTPSLVNGVSVGVQQVADAVADDPALAADALDLCLSCQRRFGDSRQEAAMALRDASAAMMRLADRAAFEASVQEYRRGDADGASTTPAPSLADIIEQRRRHGYNPSGLARGLRTTASGSPNAPGDPRPPG